MKIAIDWLSDVNDCPTCGQRNYAYGAQVYIDDEPVKELEFPPKPCCCANDRWTDFDVYAAIFHHLGHNLEYCS